MPRTPPAKATRSASRSARPKPTRRAPALSAAEREMIAFFSPWGEVLGVAPSVAQIYGLLFASPTPLSLDEIRERLGASKGSVSQGLNFLRDRGLLVVASGESDRRERFAAMAAPGLFVRAQLQGEVAPRLEAGAARLESLRALTESDPVLRERVGKLDGWHRRGRELLPMLLNLLGG